jgi:hypothetical protein
MRPMNAFPSARAGWLAGAIRRIVAAALTG